MNRSELDEIFLLTHSKVADLELDPNEQALQTENE